MTQIKTLKESMVHNLNVTSRTANGVSDTSSSADKPSLVTDGESLKDQSTKNFERSIELIYKEQYKTFDKPDDLREFIENIANTISEGLLENEQGLYRTWETKFKHQTLTEEIEEKFSDFMNKLYDRLHSEHPDPIAIAAWAEQEIDSHIHPFSDGCGRTSKVVAAWILARYHMPLPQWSTRGDYYSHIDFGDNTLESWTEYYRNCIEDSLENLTLYTHQHVDCDALASIWAYKKYATPKNSNIHVKFTRADDKLDLPQRHIALDHDSGLKGYKEDEGIVHSAFQQIMDIYASKEDRELLKPIITYIDHLDSSGGYLSEEIGNIEEIKALKKTGLNSVLESLRLTRDDEELMIIFEDIFNGFYNKEKERLLAEKEADQAEFPFGQEVAIIKDKKNKFTNGILFDRGARVVIYTEGINIGAVRKDGERFRLNDILEKYINNRENDGWFFHPNGFLVSHGTFKSPALMKSTIGPEELAEIIFKNI